MKHVSRPKSAAVKNSDIADILGQKYLYRIDIGHGYIYPPLVQSRLYRRLVSLIMSLVHNALKRYSGQKNESTKTI